MEKLQGEMDDDTTKEVFAVYRRGADNGNATAMGNLGLLYNNGFGVERDYAKAREWYEKAADKGNARAMYFLGLLYITAQGVPRDYAKAHEWFTKAAEKGELLAMSGLGSLYQQGFGVPQDYAKAREWFTKAAEGGDANAMASLGRLYLNGEGVAQDNAKAREWFEKAFVNGEGFGMNYVLGLEQPPISRAAAAGRYSEALQLQEALAAKIEAFETKRERKPSQRTAQALRDVARYALFAREFTKALSVSDRADALFPVHLGIESNQNNRARALMFLKDRAHALMFLERGEESKELYLIYKGEPLPEQDGRLWERVIAEDFAEFRKAGLTHPMMAEIEQELGASP
jgi:tetratricopeptide (TPR) repeat protein